MMVDVAKRHFNRHVHYRKRTETLNPNRRGYSDFITKFATVVFRNRGKNREPSSETL